MGLVRLCSTNRDLMEILYVPFLYVRVSSPSVDFGSLRPFVLRGYIAQNWILYLCLEVDDKKEVTE
jgi:hypothetical protein